MKTDRIYLRLPEISDLNLLYSWENNTELWSISNTSTPFSKETLKHYIESVHDIYSEKQIRFMIVNAKTHICVGCIDLFDFDPKNRKAGIGVLIADENNRKKGLASDALTLVKEYAFKILNINQLYCTIPEDNEKSIALFEKCGFEKQAEFKQWLLVNHIFLNAYFYQCFYAK
jgi:diamine N-acetyltransferase